MSEYKNQLRAGGGQFGPKIAGGEKRGAAISLRLPESLDRELRAAAGWQSSADNAALRDWIEAAIREKLGDG